MTAIMKKWGKPLFVRRHLHWSSAWNGVVALTAVVIAAGFYAFLPSTGTTIQRALNHAYTEYRTLDLRFEGAEYAPKKQADNESSASRFLRPSLLFAEGNLSDQFSQHASDARWWHMKGRAELLDRELISADRSLTRANDLAPGSPDILLDLASTYFQEAEAGATQRYSDSLELLGRILAMEPARTTAIFNRAIVEEKIFAYAAAESDWQQYLKLDPNGNWRQEALLRWEAVREKLNSHRSALSRDLSAESLAARDEATARAVDELAEEFIDMAITDWLPLSLSPTNSPEASKARKALNLLADTLARRHHDLWLRAYLRSSPASPASLHAAKLLQQARLANLAGETRQAAAFSHSARQAFRKLPSRAGEVRASLEELFAARQHFSSRKCLDFGRQLARQVRGQRYPLIRSHMFLETCNCLMRSGNQQEAAASLDRSEAEAIAGKYSSQLINIQNYRASMDRMKGDFFNTWQKSLAALARFWSGTFPDKRAFSFYAALADLAAERRQWQAFLSLQEEATLAIDATNLHSFRAMTHFRLAQAAMSVGKKEIASDEFLRSDSLFATMQSEESSTYRADGEINLAKIEIAEGKTEEALERLERVRPIVPELESYLVQFAFHTAAGTAYEQTGRYDKAIHEFQDARDVADKVLRSVISQRERLRWAQELQETYRGLTRSLYHTGQAMQAFQLWESYRVAQAQLLAPKRVQAALPHGLHREISSGIEQLVPPGNALVSYFVERHGLIIWTVTQRGIESKYVQVDMSDVMHASLRLRSLCSDEFSSIAEIEVEAQKLYRWLVHPVEDHLAGNRLLIELDSLLGPLPLEVLTDAHQTKLQDRFYISYIPGLFYLPSSKASTIDLNSQFALVIGNPRITGNMPPGLVPLEDAESEARHVASHFARSKLLVGDQATLQRIQQYLSTASVFHFAGHSWIDPQHLTLLLAPDGNQNGAYYWDISSLPASQLRSCALIVLSACSTEGVTSSDSGNSVDTVQALLSVGVPQVVASRWPVNSSTTADLMDSVYKNLSVTHDMQGSLRMAAITLSKTRPHPYFWAAFSLFGRP